MRYLSEQMLLLYIGNFINPNDMFSYPSMNARLQTDVNTTNMWIKNSTKIPISWWPLTLTQPPSYAHSFAIPTPNAMVELYFTIFLITKHEKHGTWDTIHFILGFTTEPFSNLCFFKTSISTFYAATTESQVYTRRDLSCKTTTLPGYIGKSYSFHCCLLCKVGRAVSIWRLDALRGPRQWP